MLMVRFRKKIIRAIWFGVFAITATAGAENDSILNAVFQRNLLAEKQALRQAFLNLETEFKFRGSENQPVSLRAVSEILDTIEKQNMVLTDEIALLKLESASRDESMVDINAQATIMAQRWAMLRVWFTQLYVSADEFSRDRLLEYFLSDAILSFSEENYDLAARQFRFILESFEEEFTRFDGVYFYAAESNLALGYFNEAWFLFEKLIEFYPQSMFSLQSITRILKLSVVLNRPESFEKYRNFPGFTSDISPFLSGLSCLNAGDTEQALNFFQQVATDSPTYDVVQQQIMILESETAPLGDASSAETQNEIPAFLYVLRQLCQRPLNVSPDEKDVFFELEQRWHQKLKSAKWLNQGHGSFRLPETDAMVQYNFSRLRLIQNERFWYQLSISFLESYPRQAAGFQFEQLNYQFSQIARLSLRRRQMQANKAVISEHILDKQHGLEARLHEYDQQMRSVQGKIRNEQHVMEKQERQVYFDKIYFTEALNSYRTGSRLPDGSVEGER